MNDKSSIIKYLFFLRNNIKGYNEIELNNAINEWDKIESMIKEKKIYKIKKENKQLLIKYFNDKNNKEYLIKIFSNEQYEYFIDVSYIENLLSKLSIIFHTNKKGSEPYIIINEIFYGENNIKIDYEQLINLKNKYKNEYMLIHKFFDFLKEVEVRIKNEFKYDYNLRIKLEFETREENSDNFICSYIFYEPIDNKPLKFKEDNILINGTNTLSSGFSFLMEEINDPKYEKINYK